MKKTKPQSTEPCSYCRAAAAPRQRATWRSQSLAFTKYACDEHRAELEADEKAHGDDGYMSEADHQTWGRL